MPYRALGALPDKHDDRDHIFESQLLGFVGMVPPSVDLRKWCTPVRDQGQQGSCTGHAITAFREFVENKIGNPNPAVILSPAFLYYEERKLEGSVADCDAGAYPRDGFKVLHKMGVCPEAEDPYNDLACGAPNQHAVTAAKKFKISSYQRITTRSGLKQALAHGDGCVIGIAVYESFESDAVRTTGHVPMPKPNEDLLGGHALFCCGYKDDNNYAGGGYLIVKNSWGTAFGDKGYVYIPYAYVIPKLMSDIWTGTV